MLLYPWKSSRRAAALLLILGIFAAKPVFAVQAVVTRNLFFAPSAAGFSPYIEAYWQIDPQSLLFKKEEGSFRSSIRTDITIATDTGVVHEDHYLLVTQPQTDGRMLYQQNIIDLKRYSVKPGRYTLQIVLTDTMNSSLPYTFNDSFTVEPLIHPTLSDIQLVDTIINATQTDIFSRNGVLQIPLCTNFFPEQRKSLHYYAEFYQPAEETEPMIICRSYISQRPFDLPMHNLLQTDTMKDPGALQILEGKFALHTLPSGNYYLNLSIEDTDHKKLAAKSLFFQLMNTKPVAYEPIASKDSNQGTEPSKYVNLNKTFVVKYTPSQIRAILKMLIPIAEPNERAAINSFIRNPDDTYSRYFIYNFWLKRDKTDPERSWKAYAEKVKEVNKLFGSSMLLGYESDRGMLYLRYGAPTERIVVNNESNAYPYEVWQYNSLPHASNALFLFYKPGLISNDYKLLHSTVTGDIRNRNWRAQLFLNGASTDAASSRAEQYFGNR